MTRLLLLSDTHGAIDPRIARLAGEVDLCVHAGDIGHGGVLMELSRLCSRVVAVRGNNDHPGAWPAADRPVLTQLPREAAVELPGGRLMVLHGDQVMPAGTRHAKLRRRYAGARAVLYGHSHQLTVDRDAAPWVLNPGAAGRTRTYGGPSCLLLTADEAGWEVEAVRFEGAARGRAAGGR